MHGLSPSPPPPSPSAVASCRCPQATLVLRGPYSGRAPSSACTEPVVVCVAGCVCVAGQLAVLRHNMIPVLMELLVMPISLVGSARQDQDTGLIELVLCLVRNLLQVRLCVCARARVCGG
jgi:hypothetical protein